MGEYVSYSAVEELRNYIDEFLKDKSLEKISDNKLSGRHEIKAKGTISNRSIEASWELRNQQDVTSIRMNVLAGKKYKIKALIEIFIFIILLLVAYKMVLILLKPGFKLMPFLILILFALYIYIFIFKKYQNTLANKLEKDFKIFIQKRGEVRIEAPVSSALISESVSWIFLAILTVVDIGVLIFLYKYFQILFVLFLPLGILMLLERFNAILWKKERLMRWKSELIGYMHRWIYFEFTIILFVFLLYINNSIIVARYENEVSKKQIPIGDIFTISHFISFMDNKVENPIEHEIFITKAVVEKNISDPNINHSDTGQNKTYKSGYIRFLAGVLIILSTSICLILVSYKRLLKIPQKWQLSLAESSLKYIKPPSLGLKSKLSNILFIPTIILWSLSAGVINIVFVITSFDMVYYILTNRTLILKNLSVIYSWLQTDFIIFKNILNIKRCFLFHVGPKIILLFVALPFIYLSLKLISNIIAKISKNAKKTLVPHKGLDTVIGRVKEHLIEVSKKEKITPPKILVVRSNRNIIFSKIKLFSHRATIVLSDKLLDRLDEKETHVLMAHELGHIRQGLRKFEILKILSKLTLFPNLFMTLAVDYRKHEDAADRYTFELIKEKEIIKKTLIKVAVINFRLERQIKKRKINKLTMALPSRIKMMLNRLKILDDFLFGEALIGYSHPFIKERIRKIETF